MDAFSEIGRSDVKRCALVCTPSGSGYSPPAPPFLLSPRSATDQEPKQQIYFEYTHMSPNKYTNPPPPLAFYVHPSSPHPDLTPASTHSPLTGETLSRAAASPGCFPLLHEEKKPSFSPMRTFWPGCTAKLNFALSGTSKTRTMVLPSLKVPTSCPFAKGMLG